MIPGATEKGTLAAMYDVPSLLDQRAVDPHLARWMLDGLEERRCETRRLAIVLCGACAVLWPLGLHALLWPLGAGAAVALALYVRASDGRRSLLAVLVAQRSAYVLPEVAHAGERLATPQARAALAASLERLVAASRRGPVIGPALVPTERIAANADQLLRLASLLARGEAVVHPSTVALLQRLLTSSLASPLLNLDVPEQELAILLRRVRTTLES
jgi:hypothetical protein